jgi:putative hemolysin
MIPTMITMAVAVLLLAVFFCTVELCVLLVHRLRLKVLDDSGDPRARVLNRLLEKQDLAATSANVGVLLAVAGVAAVSWLLGVYAGMSTAAHLGVIGLTIFLLLLLVTILPRVVVRARPTRVLIALAYPFAFFTWVFYPLSRVLLALRGGLTRGSNSSRLASHPSLVLREDLRRLITRPDLAILGEREAEMAQKLFRFGSTLVRDLMTPSANVIALPESATVGEVYDVVRDAGFTRIPVFRESRDSLIGLINVHDVLDVPEDRTLDGFLRPAARVPSNSLAHSLFVHLQRTPHWMAFVEDDGCCVGIVTVEDLVEEVLGEIYDEFELPRPRYVPAGRRRLRVSGSLSLRELGIDLRLSRPELDDRIIAAAVEEALGRPPLEGENVDIGGLRVWVTRVADDRATEVEVGRSG